MCKNIATTYIYRNIRNIGRVFRIQNNDRKRIPQNTSICPFDLERRMKGWKKWFIFFHNYLLIFNTLNILVISWLCIKRWWICRKYPLCERWFIKLIKLLGIHPQRKPFVMRIISHSVIINLNVRRWNSTPYICLHKIKKLLSFPSFK